MKLLRRINDEPRAEIVGGTHPVRSPMPASFEWSLASRTLTIRMEAKQATYSMQLTRPEVQRLLNLLSQVRL